MTIKPTLPDPEPDMGRAFRGRPAYLRRSNSSYAGQGQRTDIADEWHRILTGRQSPEPVSTKLKTIYGNVLSEKLPDDMLNLLSQLDD